MHRYKSKKAFFQFSATFFRKLQMHNQVYFYLITCSTNFAFHFQKYYHEDSFINISGILWQMSQRWQILCALLVPAWDDELHYQQPGERPCLALPTISNQKIWAYTFLWTGVFLSGGSILSTIRAQCHLNRLLLLSLSTCIVTEDTAMCHF